MEQKKFLSDHIINRQPWWTYPALSGSARPWRSLTCFFLVSSKDKNLKFRPSLFNGVKSCRNKFWAKKLHCFRSYSVSRRDRLLPYFSCMFAYNWGTTKYFRSLIVSHKRISRDLSNWSILTWVFFIWKSGPDKLSMPNSSRLAMHISSFSKYKHFLFPES